MTTELCRLAIVGLGVHGLDVARHFLSKPGAWALVAAVDPSAAAFARFQSRFYAHAVPCFKNIADMLAATDPEIVLIATTSPYHLKAAQELLDCGYQNHIVIEKPLSNNLLAATAFVETIEATPRFGRVIVDMNRRGAPLYQAVIRVLQQGLLGRLVHIQHYQKCKISMKGSHYLDMAMWFAGGIPCRVIATLSENSVVDPRGAAFFDPEGCMDIVFANGVTFQMDTRQDTAEPGMRLDFQNGQVHINVHETEIRIRRNGDEWSTLAADNTPRTEWIENIFDSLLDSTSQYVPCSLPEALTNLTVFVAAFGSHSAGGVPVNLPLSPESSALILPVA